ncbi:MAG: hypothetical protein NTX09_14560, partial [Verrucomicrobia bacterium]|nr:hypothetical protein [Verrucomicrobiota bacterium]
VAAGFIATRPNVQSWEWDVRQTGGLDWTDQRNFTDTNNRSGGTRVNNDNRTWITEKWTGTLNARWVVPFMEKLPTVMKFGGKWDEEYRYNRTDSDLDIWSYIGPGGNTATYNTTIGAWQNTAYGNWANVGPQFIAPIPFDGGTTNSFHIFGLDGKEKTPPRVSRSEVAKLFRSRRESQRSGQALPLEAGALREHGYAGKFLQHRVCQSPALQTDDLRRLLAGRYAHHAANHCALRRAGRADAKPVQGV